MPNESATPPRPTTSRTLVVAAAAAAFLGPATTAHADPPRNLPVTDAIRAQLLEAGAAHKGIPASDFTGLTPGKTYYAYDLDTATYWAGAHLIPSANAYEAQVADQDAGSYLLFEQPRGGVWTAFNDGVARSPGCPAPLPATIIALWEWDPQKCRPVPDR
jgi:hypothetical protein